MCPPFGLCSEGNSEPGAFSPGLLGKEQHNEGAEDKKQTIEKTQLKAFWEVV